MKKLLSASIAVLLLVLLIILSQKNIPNAVEPATDNKSDDSLIISLTDEVDNDTNVTESNSPDDELLEVQDTPKIIFTSSELSDEIKERITGLSFPDYEQNNIAYDDLRYLTITYYGFDGKSHQGYLICNKLIADDLLEIFTELYYNQYPIEKISLVDDYNADDETSMANNNTSCFCYRLVEGQKNLSKHAYGLAIDINPLNNPYVSKNSDGSLHVSPIEGAAYADRSSGLEHMIDKEDLCYKLFTEHGFFWGGNWKYQKDYQHFQKDF